MRKMMMCLPTWAMFLLLTFPFVFYEGTSLGLPIASSIIVVWLFCTGSAIKGNAAIVSSVRVRWFNAALAYVAFYGLFVGAIFGNTVTGLALPFHLLAVVSLFSSIFMAAKMVVVCEDKRSVTANRCIGTFLMFWFFPVGIWFIHPRVKNIISNTAQLSS